MDKHRVWLTVLTLIGVFVGALGLPALGNTITVTTTDDEFNGDGDCSLREAIHAANTDTAVDNCAAGSGADTIVLAAAQTYTLSKDDDGGGHATDSGANNDDLDITSAITIQGNGAIIERSTAVTCNLNDTAATGEFRIFEVTTGGNLTLQDVTVQNGCADGGVFSDNTEGGGILSGGTLTITNSTFSGNSAIYGSGGGILNGGTVNIKNSIVGNSTSGGNCLNFDTINASGVNFATDGSCAGFTSVTSGALNLGSLQVNAPGTTATHALLSGSAAIDAATDCTDLSSNPVTQDQRGVARSQGAACDVGAYEAVVVTLTIAGAGTGSGTVASTGITCTISIGSTSGDCSESALPGANPTVTLSAAADPGSTFAGWSGHADCADGVVTINSNKVCTAQFNVVPQRTLTVAGAGTGTGTVTATGISCTITAGSTSGDCSESYAHGTSVTLTATPNSGSTFTGWSGCDSVSGMDCQVTLTAAKLVTVQFTDPSLGCPNLLVEARPTTARFTPNSRRAHTRNFSVTVRNNSGGPVTITDITLRPGTFDGTYTLVRISPTLPQTVLHRRSRTFTIMVRKAAATPEQTVTAPFFDVQMSCGMLPASERLIPLRVKGLQVEQHAGQVRVETAGEGIASMEVELFDLSGRRLLTQGGEGRELTIAVNRLAKGVYLAVVRVQGFDGREYVGALRKLVIMRR